MMTHHERCVAAIAGAPVDRAPRYVAGVACEVASRMLGREAFGGTGSLHYAEACAWMRGEKAHEEFEEKLCQDLVDLYRALDVDVFRMPWRKRERPTRQIDEVSFLYGDPDGAHTICKYSPDSGDFAAVASSGTGQVDVEEYARQVARGEEAADGGGLEAVELDAEHLRICERLGEEFFVVYNGGGIGVGYSVERMTLLALAPEVMRRELMLQARYTVACGELLARTPHPRVMIGGLDMAGNDGPMYSPEMFREVTLPAYSHVMERLGPLGFHVVFRSDGVLWPVSDMLFVEAGVNGYGEVDRDVSMTVAAIRKRYPRLVIWGNFSARFLAGASAGEVRDEARRIVEESAGTGYFHGCSNAILRGTPVENVEAMFSV